MADPVKIPSRDVVIDITSPTVDVAEIEKLLFEDLTSLELTKFTKYNTVSGINAKYNVISNLSDINREFDPNSLLSATKTTSSLFDIYGIDLLSKIPTDRNYVYIGNDPTNELEYGSIVIDLDNIGINEFVEIEIDVSGTIYRVRS